MTGSTDPDAPAPSKASPGVPARSRTALDARWRAAREAAQEQVLPEGQVVVSCPAPFGSGGLGRHLQEIADALDRRGPEAICLCGVALAHARSAPSPRHHELRPTGLITRFGQLTRYSPAWSNLRRSIAFDGCAAAQLPDAEHLIAFNGQALKQFAAAKRAGYRSVSVLSANSHMRRVVRQHKLAHRQYPLERSWATRLLRRNLSEYEQADRIFVASRYTWESFVEEGCREEKLSLFPFVPDPRFQPAAEPPSPTTFDVVFIGRLAAAKGVPLLVDAVRRLAHADLRLVLVGGWSSRGMRRFLQEARARDPRIEIGPGDPLPRLQNARLCAHPTYEDGFAYAPAEALACGVPVLVSEDTGMKDLVDPGVNGLVLPTGDLSALTEAIDAAYRGEILS
ncbi:MAG TPA: glycosyltransferase family 4 protein [Solirubrobacteraceae bacterium]|nr:glycosyltransferase family 4 protein [Solirubrobacteraceae bacterium]